MPASNRNKEIHTSSKRKQNTRTNSTYSCLFVRKVPKDLERRFTAWCRLRGIPPRDKIKQLMQETLARKRTKEEMAPRRRRRPSQPYQGPMTQLFYHKFPRALHNAFAAWCRLRGITIQEKLLSLIDEVTIDRSEQP